MAEQQEKKRLELLAEEFQHEGLDGVLSAKVKKVHEGHYPTLIEMQVWTHRERDAVMDALADLGTALCEKELKVGGQDPLAVTTTSYDDFSKPDWSMHCLRCGHTSPELHYPYEAHPTRYCDGCQARTPQRIERRPPKPEEPVVEIGGPVTEEPEQYCGTNVGTRVKDCDCGHCRVIRHPSAKTAEELVFGRPKPGYGQCQCGRVLDPDEEPCHPSEERPPC